MDGGVATCRAATPPHLVATLPSLPNDPSVSTRRKCGPAVPGDFEVQDPIDDFDELDLFASPPPQSSGSGPTPGALPRSESIAEVKPPSIFHLSRVGSAFAAVKDLVFKPQDPEPNLATVAESSRIQGALEAAESELQLLREELRKLQNESSQIQEVREAAAQAQSELEFTREELRKAQEKCSLVPEVLEAEVQAQSELHFAREELRKAQEECKTLRDAERQAQNEIQRLMAERQRAQTERADLMSLCSKRSTYIDDRNAQIVSLREEAKKYQKRIEVLVGEKGSLNSQLKQQLRLGAPSDGRARTGDGISLDPFDNKVDQVSEAAVKGAVESLNDSLDNFTMALLDEAEELAKRHSHSSRPSAAQEHEKGAKLLPALAEYSHDENKRGFLLDAIVHHGLVVELDMLFLSGEVVSRVLESPLLDYALGEMTKHEPWTVVQRWRALTAAATKDRMDASTEVQTESIITLLAWVYRQPLETFEPLIPKIQSQLASLYDEARHLALVARRDVLSVRMLVVVGPTEPRVDPNAVEKYLPYNPDAVTSVYPEMKVAAGDEVIGLYKFGLKRLTEKGQVSHLIKPEVTTTALLREMAKT
ncbi:hypothetical protein B0H19DRAFT_1261675 [Mycena capillaripes]|nr:hypothetical protein B0H19DRAFT_1261675 [Mycena capillaripes]